MDKINPRDPFFPSSFPQLCVLIALVGCGDATTADAGFVADASGTSDAASPPDGGQMRVDSGASSTDAAMLRDAFDAPSDGGSTRDAAIPAVDAGALNDTPLARLAASMAPNSWAELETEGFDSDTMQVVVNDEGRQLHIAGWTDDGHWDPDTGQFLYMGFRLRTKFIAYNAYTNRWHVNPSFEWPLSGTAFGHVYGNNAHDPSSGAYYHNASRSQIVFRYDLATGAWTALPETPDRGDFGTTLEHFPELGGLVRHTRRGLHVFDEESETWRTLESPHVSGYHSLARYNPMRQEVLLVGGNDSRRSVARLDREGTLTALVDSPIEMSIRADKLVVHPVTGHYLFFSGDVLYDLDSESEIFTEIDGYTPPSSIAYQVPATIPELGVVLFIDRAVRLYKPLDIVD